MTDISKEAVERLAIDVKNRLKMRTVGSEIVARASDTLRAQAALIAKLEAALATASSMTFWRPIIEEQSCGEWTPEIIKTDASTMARNVAALLTEDKAP